MQTVHLGCSLLGLPSSTAIIPTPPLHAHRPTPNPSRGNLRPRNYREEIIPTALELYASLAQDVLEGVDLEVGHTLPESIFVVTGTARPSWPRWGGSPSAATATPRLIEGGAGRGSNDVDGSHTTRNNGSGGTGFGRSPREASGRGRGMTRAREFLRGPWVVFHVARGDYLEFYRDQAAVLDQAVGGSAAEVENMLM